MIPLRIIHDDVLIELEERAEVKQAPEQLQTPIPDDLMEHVKSICEKNLAGNAAFFPVDAHRLAGIALYCIGEIRSLRLQAQAPKSDEPPFDYERNQALMGGHQCQGTDDVEEATQNSFRNPMGVQRFTKKRVTVEALQWTGKNLREVITFTQGPPDTSTVSSDRAWSQYCELVEHEGLKIRTLEGDMRASIGDWIIKGVKGEFYPCKPDIFETTYGPAEEAYSMPPVTPGQFAADISELVAPTDRQRVDGLVKFLTENRFNAELQASETEAVNTTLRQLEEWRAGAHDDYVVQNRDQYRG